MTSAKLRISMGVAIAIAVAAGETFSLTDHHVVSAQPEFATPASEEFTCTQDQKTYQVGDILCINHTPFKCVKDRGWVKNGTSC